MKLTLASIFCVLNSELELRAEAMTGDDRHAVVSSGGRTSTVSRGVCDHPPRLPYPQGIDP